MKTPPTFNTTIKRLNPLHPDREPAVDFDCPFGPADIIRDREEGLLVPPEDVAALTEALELLISNPDRRKRMGENARKITERFGLEKVMGQWEQMIKDLR